MKFSLACGDVMPGCVSRFESPSKEDLLDQVGTHAAADHGLTEITPEVLRAVEEKIVLVPA
jgi:predicted small metal-binding protein